MPLAPGTWSALNVHAPVFVPAADVANIDKEVDANDRTDICTTPSNDATVQTAVASAPDGMKCQRNIESETEADENAFLVRCEIYIGETDASTQTVGPALMVDAAAQYCDGDCRVKTAWADLRDNAEQLMPSSV